MKRPALTRLFAMSICLLLCGMAIAEDWFEHLLKQRTAATETEKKATAPAIPDFGTGSYTIVAWVKTETDGSIVAVTKKGKWSKHCKSLFIEGGKVALDIGWVGDIKGETEITDGKWHCITLVGGRRHAIYVDGKLDTDEKLESSPSDPKGSFLSIGFTNEDFPEQSQFKGQIDEIQIYDRCLSAKEILSFDKKPGNYVKGLIRRWSFEDNLKDSVSESEAAALRGKALYGTGVKGKCLALDGRTGLRGAASAGNGKRSLPDRLSERFSDDRSRTEIAWCREAGILASDTETVSAKKLLERLGEAGRAVRAKGIPSARGPISDRTLLRAKAAFVQAKMSRDLDAGLAKLEKRKKNGSVLKSVQTKLKSYKRTGDFGTYREIMNQISAWTWARQSGFKATGNTNPSKKAEKRKVGEVIVTFDKLPTGMSFDLPAFPCMVTENGIKYYNGWAETYDAKAGVGSCEPLMDHDNKYTRMWIESANDARITVRWRGALISDDQRIAHRDQPKVSPYGPGDWVDEKYIIYPDGVHVRYATIYSHFASVAKPFGWNRNPPNYIFEFQEMLFRGHMSWYSPKNKGHLPEDDIQTEALTLIKMDGSHTKISYDPYPVRHGPSERELFKAFGEFSNANIFVVNTKSQYHPFTIGRTDGVSLSPYAPERPTRKGIFQSWPQTCTREEGYDGVALGHIVLRTFYKRTKTTISQVYLSGFTKSAEPEKEIVPLAHSWLKAPALTGEAYDGKKVACNYDMAQRAYRIDSAASTKYLKLVMDASAEKPAVRPALLLRNCSHSDALIQIDGATLTRGKDYRAGFYRKLEFDKDTTWNNVLILWLDKTISSSAKINIKPRRSSSKRR